MLLLVLMLWLNALCRSCQNVDDVLWSSTWGKNNMRTCHHRNECVKVTAEWKKERASKRLLHLNNNFIWPACSRRYSVDGYCCVQGINTKSGHSRWTGYISSLLLTLNIHATCVHHSSFSHLFSICIPLNNIYFSLVVSVLYCTE